MARQSAIAASDCNFLTCDVTSPFLFFQWMLAPICPLCALVCPNTTAYVPPCPLCALVSPQHQCACTTLHPLCTSVPQHHCACTNLPPLCTSVTPTPRGLYIAAVASDPLRLSFVSLVCLLVVCMPLVRPYACKRPLYPANTNNKEPACKHTSNHWYNT